MSDIYDNKTNYYKMNEQELKEMIEAMARAGMNPQLCDTNIPLDVNPVACGNPTELGNDLRETFSIPKGMLSMRPEMMLTVTGNSMVDVGIEDGDLVKMAANVSPRSGDIVVVGIGSDFTVKSYYEDDDGTHWLVPQNEELHDMYKPIMLDGGEDIMICGIVTEVVKRMPRVSNRNMKTTVNRARQERSVTIEIPPLRVSQMIREMGKMIVIGRQWYAVYRTMVDLSLIEREDYDGFCARIAEELPQHQHLPNSVEMSRMAIGSFAKSVSLWVESNAPVQGKRFKTYLELAQKAKDILLNN